MSAPDPLSFLGLQCEFEAVELSRKATAQLKDLAETLQAIADCDAHRVSPGARKWLTHHVSSLGDTSARAFFRACEVIAGASESGGSNAS